MYPYVKFEMNVCNHYQDNERKLMSTEGRMDEKDGLTEHYMHQPFFGAGIIISDIQFGS
jgi:hypothetical protein